MFSALKWQLKEKYVHDFSLFITNFYLYIKFVHQGQRLYLEELHVQEGPVALGHPELAGRQQKVAH